MSAYTNFQDGDTLTAEKLNEAFGLIDTKVDLVLPAAQEAVETASQTATAVAEMSRVMTETFAIQQAEIDEAVKSVADKTSKSYVDAGDEANSDKIDELEESMGDAIGQAIDICKAYTDDEIDGLEDDITTAYTAADTSTLNTAKDYADDQDVATLADAKDYTDECVEEAYEDAKDYADAQDATNLAAAKSYTDDAVSGVSVGRWLTLQLCEFDPQSNTFYIDEEDEQPTKTWSVTIWCSDPAMVPVSYAITKVSNKTAVVLKWNPDDYNPSVLSPYCTVHVEEIKYATV